MNSIYSVLLSVMMLFPLCLIFTSCGNDAEDDNVINIDNDDAKSHTKNFCPDSKHPHMIDLGLPSGTLWACCNVGASSPDGYGNYYAWGETSPKSKYRSDNYEFHMPYGYKKTPRNILGTRLDAAWMNWGNVWFMPTCQKIKELINNCTYEWTTLNGVIGGKFTGPNGGFIFLPAAGYRHGEDLEFAGLIGSYWSDERLSSSMTSDSDDAFELRFHSEDAYLSHGSRICGLLVRPVGLRK